MAEGEASECHVGIDGEEDEEGSKCRAAAAFRKKSFSMAQIDQESSRNKRKTNGIQKKKKGALEMNGF